MSNYCHLPVKKKKLDEQPDSSYGGLVAEKMSNILLRLAADVRNAASKDRMSQKISTHRHTLEGMDSKRKGRDNNLGTSLYSNVLKVPPTHRNRASVMINIEAPVTEEDQENTDEIMDTMGTKEGLNAIRSMFNMLEHKKANNISVVNLFPEMMRLDKEITFEEVEKVISQLDFNSNGTVDFDKFLFHVVNMDDDALFGSEDNIDEEQKKKKSKRRKHFYTALTQFTLKEIEKSLCSRVPHVIGHYADGVQLIGLAADKIKLIIKRIIKNAPKSDSPYSKPLTYYDESAEVVRKKKKPCKKKIGLSKDLPTMSEPTDDGLTKEIADTMELLVQHGGSLTTEQSFTKIIECQKILELVIPQLPSCQAIQDGKMLEALKKKHQSVECTNIVKKKCKHRPTKPLKYTKKMMKGLRMASPRIHYINVDLPGLKEKTESQYYTEVRLPYLIIPMNSKANFNDFLYIRDQTREAVNEYYSRIRNAVIKQAWEHWDRLYSKLDHVLSNEKLNKFRSIYELYFPHREAEEFVVCPWKPGPFHFIQHQTSQNAYIAPKPLPTIRRGHHNSRSIQKAPAHPIFVRQIPESGRSTPRHIINHQAICPYYVPPKTYIL